MGIIKLWTTAGRL